MAHLDNYRIQTIRIRNVMEYELFNEELARLTEEAIDSVGGKLDAYQRMFDEEVDSHRARKPSGEGGVDQTVLNSLSRAHRAPTQPDSNKLRKV